MNNLPLHLANDKRTRSNNRILRQHFKIYSIYPDPKHPQNKKKIMQIKRDSKY